VTLADYFTTYAARQVWIDGTQKAMSLAVRTAPFSVVELRKIRPTHVESWVKDMTVRGLAPGTIKTRFVNVRSVFRAAMRDKLIGSDPTDGVRLPRQRRAEAAMSIPSPEDVASLLEAADERFRSFVAVCAFAGLRLGEAAALQVGDVDFLRRQVAVSRQVQRAGAKKVDIRPPKYGSERVVPIPDELIEMLSVHIALGHRSEWLFQGAGDTPPHQNTVAYWWRKTLTAAGLSGIRLHDLRHFYASGLIAAGCDVVTVQRALGHSRATTTLNTYSHLWPSAEDRTRSAAATIAGEVLGSRAGTQRAGGGV
jgi:integrase